MSRHNVTTQSPDRQGQVAGRKLYDVSDGGIQFVSTRTPGFVQVPNYVIDMYLPLIGAQALGVYLAYCRLAMDHLVRKNSGDFLARSLRMSKHTLAVANEALEACGLVTVRVPVGHEILMHYSTTIEVHDSPRTIAPELIARYGLRYEPLTPWLVAPTDDEKPAEFEGPTRENPLESLTVLPSTADGATRHGDTVLPSTAKNEDLEMKTLEDEEQASSSSPFKPAEEQNQTPGTAVEITPQDNPSGSLAAMLEALKDVCDGADGVRKRRAAAKALVKQGRTPAEVVKRFGEGGRWFDLYPGINGGKPHASQVLDRFDEMSQIGGAAVLSDPKIGTMFEGYGPRPGRRSRYERPMPVMGSVAR